ncbi:hypothetical protein BDV38DRAFT_260463 [Aspergillus pseudotamarii]|uniref:Uncharacterized protein n=1 Tax=Aspergillus pseudotamarii TaxID=132259 RepID=A0A5N6SD73_ASPPS|nr:uncharacterized protein BDV38DRAFT_260463 [Aspergillus pseudotamarii]KAE8132676.1 hypothetical protein BDV38DRAFT_260463 [Aspergillus pseudotamarii]
MKVGRAGALSWGGERGYIGFGSGVGEGWGYEVLGLGFGFGDLGSMGMVIEGICEGGRCAWFPSGGYSVVWWVVLLGVVFSISISFVC